jgi:hypothetical protein
MIWGMPGQPITQPPTCLSTLLGRAAHVLWLLRLKALQLNQHPVAVGLRPWGIQQHLAQRGEWLLSVAAHREQLVTGCGRVWRPARCVVALQPASVLLHILLLRLFSLPRHCALAVARKECLGE